jgi:NADPH-dependent 2,4-dienoyl-CoA reductase/sulfur reductase-like enzyme/rhodanese-related sulfurtransferase
MPPTPLRTLIIGGVAGGASAAARLRRLDEAAEIIIYDRGPHVSFANCGLPYFVGEVIAEEGRLLVATPELFRERYAIEVCTEHEVLAIHRDRQTIEVCDLRSGQQREERYDRLILSPGARPIRPPLPGVDLPGIFSVRTIPDSRQVREWISARGAQRAVVVGGGFVGLEMAENLAHRGLSVVIIERAPQLMPPLDPEMAQLVEEHLRAAGLGLRLGDGVARFDAIDGCLQVTTASGATESADLVILAIGVQPETRLAREAGLRIGPSGGIAVDEHMRSSDPSIYAVGDAAETVDVVTGQPQVLALAGPANRQGRVAADAIAGRSSRFRGAQGTSVCGAFGLTIANTGASDRSLARAAAAGAPIDLSDLERIYLHPGHHAGYYPGARPIHMKLLYRRSDGRLLGAQAVGEEGTEKRIDVIAMAIQLGGTVHDLAEAELCYAPQYGAAKDPVNLAGFIASNSLAGDLVLGEWGRRDQELLLDVREPQEYRGGSFPGALNIPLHQLRQRHRELPRDRPVQVMCAVGQRAWLAVRLLRQLGVDARLLSVGYRTGRTLPDPTGP